MDTNFNKIISFILGLVVVIVFLAVITGRLSLRRLPFLSQRPAALTATPTPTTIPSPTKKTTPTSPVITSRPTSPVVKFPTKAPGAIPSTGSPTLLLPLLLSALGVGSYLNRKGR